MAKDKTSMYRTCVRLYAPDIEAIEAIRRTLSETSVTPCGDKISEAIRYALRKVYKDIIDHTNVASD